MNPNSNPNPPLPAPVTSQDNTTAGKARALAEKSNRFYENHWVEICLAIALLSVVVVWVTPT